MQESSIDIDKLSYEIFSILETKFLFGYDDQKLWIPKQIAPAAESKPETQPQAQPQPMMVDNGVSVICVLRTREAKSAFWALETLKRLTLLGCFFFFFLVGILGFFFYLG